MEVTVELSKLKPEIKLMESISEKKTSGALSHVLIETVGKQIKITATDLDTTIEAIVDAEIKKEGSIVILAKKLNDIVKSLDSGSVRFKQEANNWVRVFCGTSKWRMAGLAKEQFPTVPEFDADEIIIDGADLKALIKHTCFATTQEESRFSLGGAKLEVEEGIVAMVATDGSRIAIMKAEIDDLEAELEVLIPKKPLIELEKFVGNEVEVRSNQNHIKFSSDNRTLISRKLSLNFPDYTLAIPKENNVDVTFDAKEMYKAIKRVSIMADERHKSVKFLVQKDKMVITATNGEEAEETVKCVATNLEEDIEIFLNWQFLTEFLHICDAPSFKMKDGKTQVEIVDGNSVCIVMPLRPS